MTRYLRSGRPAAARCLPIQAALLACGLSLLAQTGAPPATVVIPGDRVVPESLTAAADGTLYIGSMGLGAVYRAAPGASTAELFIPPGADDLRQVLGVLVDEARGALWVCSFSEDRQGPSELYAFDLKSRRARQRYPLPDAGATCNDIAVAENGDTYVTDSGNAQILRLGRENNRLETWLGDGVFGPKDVVLDGIAIVDGVMVVNTLRTGKLFRAPIDSSGRPGQVIELRLERKLDGPDGMRAFGRRSVLLVESEPPGRLIRADIAHDSARLTTLKEGFPDDPASVALVGEYAYVLEAQWAALDRKAGDPPPRPFKATTVHVGKP